MRELGSNHCEAASLWEALSGVADSRRLHQAEGRVCVLFHSLLWCESRNRPARAHLTKKTPLNLKICTLHKKSDLRELGSNHCEAASLWEALSGVADSRRLQQKKTH